MCEACACVADSVREGFECVHGAWLRCAAGCWVVSDTAGCDGLVLIWLLVGLKTQKEGNSPGNLAQFRIETVSNQNGNVQSCRDNSRNACPLRKGCTRLLRREKSGGD